MLRVPIRFQKSCRRLRSALVVTLLAATGGMFAEQLREPNSPPQRTFDRSLDLGRQHTITWDKYSLKVDGNRTFIWACEFHYFRLPSPSLWRDVLEKIKASGFNTVQLYFSWQYHSPKSGVYDFSGIRDIDRLLTEAEDAGLYVLARPGPYINAELDAGGYPDWILNARPLRTDKPCTETCPAFGSYLGQAEDWLRHVDAIIAKHQLTTGGGSVIAYQVENELPGTGTAAYIAKLAAAVRTHGIVVPFYTNQTGEWIPSSAAGSGGERAAWNDLYGYDDYPNGHTCSDPVRWERPPDAESAFRTLDQDTPVFSPEFQGGAVDVWGGPGYDKCRAFTGPAFQRVFDMTNLANGVTMESQYMGFGGTSWGWQPAGFMYTSYDYGAMLSEGRQLTSKSPGQKQIGYFLDSIAPLRQTDIGSPVTAANVSPAGSTPCKNGSTDKAQLLDDCSAIKVYHRVNPITKTHFYFVRHNDGRSTVNSKFNVPISTPDGIYSVPQNGALQLDGRDMKVVVANYDLDAAARPQHLVYTTSNIMANKQVGLEDVLLLWAPDGQAGEIVLRYGSEPTVTTLRGLAPQTRFKNGDLIVNTIHRGLSVARISGGGATLPLLLLVCDEQTSQKMWMQITEQGTAFELGPQLVRQASIRGDTLALTGDTVQETGLTVWAPPAVTTVTWNGKTVSTGRSDDGSLSATSVLSGAPEVVLPALDRWVRHRENPEALPSFDDSSWIVADHAVTNNPVKPPSGSPVLYADDYGFHHGSVWYRGHFTAKQLVTSLSINSLVSMRGFAMVWFNGAYLGSGSGKSTFAAPGSATKIGADNVVSVLVSYINHNEYIPGKNGSLIMRPDEPRGLSVASTMPANVIRWKLQGEKGGEDNFDTVRGPMNNGGLFGEREGWFLPSHDESGWTPVSLPVDDTEPGVTWYRTHFNLKLPQSSDASVGLNIQDERSKIYRALIFLNGWNLGLYANEVGPQHVFVLPNGILHTGISDDGENTLTIAVLTPKADGGAAAGGLGRVSLTTLGVTAGGAPIQTVLDAQQPVLP